MPLFNNQGSSPLDSLINRPRPSVWQQFVNQPCIFLARKLPSWQPMIPAQPLTNPVTVVCVSDTHNSQPELPDGDLLIHAGDMTQAGSLQELQVTVDWLKAQPHPTKIVVAGNHDLFLDTNYPQKKSMNEAIDWGDIVYLPRLRNNRHLQQWTSSTHLWKSLFPPPWKLGFPIPPE